MTSSREHARLHAEAQLRDREFVALYATGLSLREIGRIKGVSHERVRQRLERAGVSMRPATRQKLPIDRLAG